MWDLFQENFIYKNSWHSSSGLWVIVCWSLVLALFLLSLYRPLCVPFLPHSLSPCGSKMTCRASGSPVCHGRGNTKTKERSKMTFSWREVQLTFHYKSLAKVGSSALPNVNGEQSGLWFPGLAWCQHELSLGWSTLLFQWNQGSLMEKNRGSCWVGRLQCFHRNEVLATVSLNLWPAVSDHPEAC